MVANDNLYIFGLSPQVIEGFELLEFDSLTSIVSSSVEKPVSQNETSTSRSQRECMACRTNFEQSATPDELRSHYKSDLHRLNLKRSLNGLDPLTENAFEQLVETQSMESISGSEGTSDEEESDIERLPTVFEKLATAGSPVVDAVEEERLVSHMNTKLPFLLLKTPLLLSEQAFGTYKALFSLQTLQSGAVVDALRQMNTERSQSGISVLLMIGGGHFAGAVISHQLTKGKGNPKNHKESMEAQRVVVLDLKTFHRYTTRRKQGGSQSASDNAHGKANSAGSSIRRYNEEALRKEVQELLLSWKEHIDKAEHIFIRATGAASRKILVGYEGSEIKLNDDRLRLFPFTTKRATLAEVKSAWVKLTYLVPLDLPKTKSLPKKKPAPTLNTPSSQGTPEPAAVSETDVHTKEIIGLLRKSKAPFLINYLRKNNLGSDFQFTPQSQYGHTPTALHYASSQGLQHMVKVLLVNLKADPTIRNQHSKVAAQLANSEQVGSMFQVCRHTLGEDYCDWSAAHVGAPKTMEEVSKEAEQAQQRVQQETAQAIKDELAKKTELELKKPTFASGGRLGGERVLTNVSDTSGMTEQQKLRFMREQRARAAMARMKQGKST